MKKPARKRKTSTKRKPKPATRPAKPTQRKAPGGRKAARTAKKAAPARRRQPARKQNPRTVAKGRKPGAPGAKTKRTRRNPDELAAAALLSEQFHGRPARTTKEVSELETSRDTLSDLGRLVSMLVWRDEDRPVELTFKGVRLAASPDGGQLYVVGQQRLDLASLGLDTYGPKDYLTIGPVESIVYQTSKAFHDFTPCEYVHEFGEEGGEAPILCYDALNEKFFLTGGSYQVQPEGITN